MTRRHRTLGLLVATLVALSGLAVPAAGAAPTDRATIVASAGYPGHGPATTATSPDGRTLLVESRAGLTKYAVGPQGIRRLGTTKVKGVAARNAKVLVHRNGRIAYLLEMHTLDSVVRVFDIAGRAPRLIRTLTLASSIREPRRRAYHDAALSPDGRVLVLLLEGGLPEQSLVTLSLTRPARPAKADRAFLIARARAVAIAPDSRSFVLDYDDPGEVGFSSYALGRNGSISGGGNGSPVVVPEWSGSESHYQIDKFVFAPDGASVYAQLERGTTADATATAIVRIRLSDSAVTDSTVTDEGADHLLLDGVSSNGARVYLRSGAFNFRSDVLPRRALWTGPDLAERHLLGGLGDVRSLSAPPAGRTRGLVFAAVKRDGHHRVLAVDPR